MRENRESSKGVTCCACGSSIKPVLILENFKDGWHIMRCPQCELTFVHPQPPLEIISSYYNGMYSDLAAEYNEQQMLWAKNSVKGYCSILDKHKSEKTHTLLDLGGGLGYYSKAFEEAGFSVTLVEQDPVSAKFAKKVLGMSNTIEKSTEEFFADNHNKYDVVFLRHVIEHSTAPDVLLSEVQKCLSDGGVLIIETDNNAGIELLFTYGTAAFYTNLYRSSFLPSSYFSLMVKRPFSVDPPRHLYGFRIPNLSKMLRKNGLEPVETKCYRLGHPVYWPNFQSPTLRDMLSNIRHLQVKRFVANTIHIIFLPFRFLLERVGLASGICIYAMKKDTRDSR